MGIKYNFQGTALEYKTTDDMNKREGYINDVYLPKNVNKGSKADPKTLDV